MTSNLARRMTPRVIPIFLVVGGVLALALIPTPTHAQEKAKDEAKEKQKSTLKPQAKDEKKPNQNQRPRLRKSPNQNQRPRLRKSPSQSPAQPQLHPIPTTRPSSRNRSRRCRKKWPRSSSRLQRWNLKSWGHGVRRQGERRQGNSDG